MPDYPRNRVKKTVKRQEGSWMSLNMETEFHTNKAVLWFAGSPCWPCISPDLGKGVLFGRIPSAGRFSPTIIDKSQPIELIGLGCIFDSGVRAQSNSRRTLPAEGKPLTPPLCLKPYDNYESPRLTVHKSGLIGWYCRSLFVFSYMPLRNNCPL